MDCITHFNGKARAIFSSAAPFVGTRIHSRCEKLIQQPAMPAVNRYHAEAAFLDPFGGFRKLFYDLENDFLGISLIFTPRFSPSTGPYTISEAVQKFGVIIPGVAFMPEC